MGGMFLILSILALVAVFAAAQDGGQPGETELAHIASLHRSVHELRELPSSPVQTAARELGLRYIEGRGVERDQIQGCALLKLAFWDSAAGPRADAAARADAEGLEKLNCSGLSTDQSEEAWVLASCGIFGVTPRVAMHHARRLARMHGARVQPFDDADAEAHAIIEVYPALAKKPKEGCCYAPFQSLLPANAVAGTDECDACICALLALAFGQAHSATTLPILVGPEEHEIASARVEGWIYYAAREAMSV